MGTTDRSYSEPPAIGPDDVPDPHDATALAEPDEGRTRLRVPGPSLLVPTAIWLAARILVTGVGAVTQRLWPAEGTPAAWPDALVRMFFQWDSAYYSSIALYGYPDDAAPVHAFFPGYPVTARALAAALHPDGPDERAVATALFLVSLVASWGAAVLMWRVAARRSGPRVAAGATALLVAGPYAVFLCASYAEALFLVLALAAWHAATRERWWAAGIACGAASWVRPNGLMLAAALAVMYVVARRATGRRWVGWGLVGVGLGVGGAVVHFVFLQVTTGSARTWADVQEQYWDRTTQWPWLTFHETAGRVLYASTLDRRIQFGLDIVFAALLVTAVVHVVRRRRWAEATYLGLTAAALMTSFTYQSIGRTTLLLFPMAMIAAETLREPRRRWVFWVVLGVGLVLLVFNTRQLAAGLWAD